MKTVRLTESAAMYDTSLNRQTGVTTLIPSSFLIVLPARLGLGPETEVPYSGLQRPSHVLGLRLKEFRVWGKFGVQAHQQP